MAADLSIAIKAVNEANQALAAASADVKRIGESAQAANPHLQQSGGHVSNLGHSAEGASGRLGNLKEGVGGLGDKLKEMIPVLAGAGAAFAGVFEVKEAVGAFNDVASAVKNVQNVTGSSAEDASRLVFAFGEMGVSSEGVAKSLKKFEQAVGGVVDAEDGGLMPAGKAQVALWKDLGVQLEDSSGKMRPTNDILLDMADKFKELGPGADATALAIKTFGKNGADMLPLLLQGRDGMAELEKESDKLGHTLSQQEVDAFKKNSLATKEFHAALEGVQIQLGAALMPVISKATEWLVVLAVAFNEKVIPAIHEFADYVETNVIPVVKAFISDEVIPKIEAFWDIIANKIVPAITDFASTIKDKLQGPLEAVTSALGGKSDILKALAIAIGIVTGAIVAWSAAQAVINVLLTANPIGAVIMGITLLIAGIVLLVMHWDDITAKFPILGTATEGVKTALAAFGTWITGTFVPAVQVIYDKTSAIIGAIVTWVQNNWHGIWDAMKPVVDTITTAISTMWTLIQTAFSTAIGIIEGIVDIFMGIFTGDWSRVKDGIMEIVGALWTAVQGTFDAFKQFLEGLYDAWYGTAKDLGGRLWSGIQDGVGDLLVAGALMIDTLWQGIQAAFTSIYTAVYNAAFALGQKIWNGVKDALGDLWPFSPSKQGIKIGLGITDGMTVGIVQGAPALISMASQVGAAVAAAITPAMVKANIGANGYVATGANGQIVASGDIPTPGYGGYTYMWGDPNQISNPNSASYAGKPADWQRHFATNPAGQSNVTHVNITVNAMDANGVQQAMPNLIYQMDRSLKRMGAVGLV